jgi:hypothetical protein
LREETGGRVKASKVEVYEHERNSASYEEKDYQSMSYQSNSKYEF